MSDKPWTLTERQYMASQDARAPGIMDDLAPSQYARMSDRAKARYDAQRRDLWDKARRASTRWRSAVRAAGVRGEPDICQEGLDLLEKEAATARRRAKEQAQQNWRSALAAARVSGVIKVGAMLSTWHYGDRRVLKVNKKSVRVQAGDPKGLKVDLRHVQGCLISERGAQVKAWESLNEDDRAILRGCPDFFGGDHEGMVKLLDSAKDAPEGVRAQWFESLT